MFQQKKACPLKEPADLLGFSHAATSGVYREWHNKEKLSSEQFLWGKMLCWCQRSATVTQITNQCMQISISGCTTHQTLMQMDYSSRRPYWVSPQNINWSHSLHCRTTQVLISANIRMTGSEFDIDGSTNPSCLVSMVQAFNGMRDIVLDTLLPVQYHLKMTAYLSIVAVYVYPFMTTVMSHTSNHLRLVPWTLQWVHFIQIASNSLCPSTSKVMIFISSFVSAHYFLCSCWLNKNPYEPVLKQKCMYIIATHLMCWLHYFFAVC